MTRRPRAGVREQWIDAVLFADTTPATKVFLIILSRHMDDGGKVQMKREDLARILDVHPQRVAERVAAARRTGLLDLSEGTGVRGQVAQYIAVLPDGPKRVPETGTQDVPRIGTHSAGFVTGKRYAKTGTHFDQSRTGITHPDAAVDALSDTASSETHLSPRAGRVPARMHARTPTNVSHPDNAPSRDSSAGSDQGSSRATELAAPGAVDSGGSTNQPGHDDTARRTA